VGRIDIFVTLDRLRSDIIQLGIIVKFGYHRKFSKYTTKGNKPEDLRNNGRRNNETH
jgi:hypothetical protein